MSLLFPIPLRGVQSPTIRSHGSKSSFRSGSSRFGAGAFGLFAVGCLGIVPGCDQQESSPADAAAAGALAMAGSSGGASMVAESQAKPEQPHAPWDWAGIVGTGQSLAVGEPGPDRSTPAAAIASTEQPYGNLKLSTGSLAWPVDPQADALQMVPLIEPIGRPAPNYPSSWPENISGETPHSAMANQLSALVAADYSQDYVSVHGEVGENGQCLRFLVKGAPQEGVNGHAFEATLIETRAITRLAQAAGMTYGVGAITVTHGECDASNADYGEQLRQLALDYATDIAEITGQTEPPLMIVSQQNAINDSAASTMAQWRIGEDYPQDAVCSGPKYQYPYTEDSIHLKVDGYRQLGEKYAQVYYERVVLQRDWRPLGPERVSRDGRVITVQFHVPVGPLQWEESFSAPHQQELTEWSAGRGFEVRAGGQPVPIESVQIEGDSVQVLVGADLPAEGVFVGYAMTGDTEAMQAPFVGTFRWGLLRDSDPFAGRDTGVAQPNYLVAFEMPVP